MQKPTFIIADDHKIFREGLKALINNEEIGIVIAEASNGKELIDILQTKKPDMAIVDISMPVMDGIEATKKALEIIPELKILALSMFGDEQYYYSMIEAGVKGFVIKTSGMHELENAIKTILAGDSYFSNELLRNIISKLSPGSGKTANSKIEKLSKREMQVLVEICKGKNNKEIAETLYISSSTIKGHKQKIFKKTNCTNTAALIVYAIKNNLISI